MVIESIKDSLGNVLAFLTGVPAGTEAGLPVRQVGAFPSALSIAVRTLNATPQQVKATAGKLMGIAVINGSAAAAFVQIHNIAAPTLGTTIPGYELQVAANSSQYLWFGDSGIALGGSAVYVVSTTLELGTVASAAGVHAYVQYV